MTDPRTQKHLAIRGRGLQSKGINGIHSHRDLMVTTHEPSGIYVQTSTKHSDANELVE
jgi:hypothetical protein